MTEPATRPRTCWRAAADIGARRRPALRLRRQPPGRRSATSKTRAAPSCGETLVARNGYLIRDYRITPDGRCPSCGTPVPGRWSTQFDGQRIGPSPGPVRLALHLS